MFNKIFKAVRVMRDLYQFIACLRGDDFTLKPFAEWLGVIWTYARSVMTRLTAFSQSDLLQ